MRHYDRRFGWVTDLRPARRALSGCHGLGCLGALGAEDCSKYSNLVAIYTRLSKKDKKKETIARAKQYIVDNQNLYNQCVQRNAAAAAPAPVVSAPVVSAPVVAPTPSVSPEPLPYVQTYGGGGGGSTSYPEMVPLPDDGGTTQAAQQPTVYQDPSTGATFYYDPATGQQVYLTQPAQVAQTAAQILAQPAAQVSSVPLTPVQYVEMPTGGGGSGGELTPYGQESYTQTFQQPTYDATGASVAQSAQQPVQEYQINEKDLIAQNGPTEYSDQWGTIQVLGLVFPAAKVAAAAAAATTITPAGQGALPGGEMKVEDFTSDYALQGGWF